MYFTSTPVFKVVLFCLVAGIRAKDAEKAADHDDSLNLLKPGPAIIQMFTENKVCDNSTLHKEASFEPDRCHNVDPLFITEFKFLAPPVCKNGTRAEYTAFQSSHCWGDVWHSWEVAETHVDQCLGTTADTKKLMSFALVCDGIRRNNSKIRLVATLLLLFGISLAMMGLLVACVLGGLALVSKTFGWLAWGLPRAKAFILSFTKQAETISPAETTKKTE